MLGPLLEDKLNTFTQYKDIVKWRINKKLLDHVKNLFYPILTSFYLNTDIIPT